MSFINLVLSGLPTTADDAISYALEYLEQWEIVEFLKDWQAGAAMTCWLPLPEEQATDIG